MRATILPQAIILTKAHRAAVSMSAKGCIVARGLSQVFLILYYPTTFMFMQL